MCEMAISQPQMLSSSIVSLITLINDHIGMPTPLGAQLREKIDFKGSKCAIYNFWSLRDVAWSIAFGNTLCLYMNQGTA